MDSAATRFVLYYDARDQGGARTERGAAGRAASADARERARAVAGDGANRLPADSVHCVTVPGRRCMLGGLREGLWAALPLAAGAGAGDRD